MRIALVHPRYATQGGVERYVSYLTRLAVARGDEVHLVVSRVEAEPPAGVVVHRVRRWGLGNLTRTVAFLAGSRGALRRHGPFDLVEGFGRSIEQDILRSSGGTHRVYSRGLVEEMENPVLRLWERARPYRHLKLWIERRSLGDPHLARVIALSRRVRDEIVGEYGVDERRIAVIHNGVDTERFSPASRPRWREEVRRAMGFGGDEVLALFVGTGFHRKGLATAIEAVARLAGRHAGLRLLVAGRDRREGRYRRLAAAVGVERIVRFLGPVAAPEKLYAASELLVLPTLYEPFGSVCLEALASGIPAITTDVSGASEVYEGDLRGLVARSPGSSEELAGLIESLMDPGRRAVLGDLGRRVALGHTLDHHFGQVFALYDDVVGERRREQGRAG